MNIDAPSYEPIRWKSGLLTLIFSLAFTFVIGRLFWVQVVEGAKYRDLAKKQYESRVPLRAERGRLVDRSMRDLATMMKTTSFAADPTMIEHPEMCAQLLSAAAEESAQVYLDRLRNAQGRFVWLARGVNTVMFPVLDTIRDRGLIRVKEPKRSFTHGPLAAQLIGTTDVDNNGLTGLELHYDGILRGQSGFVVMQRDGRGRLRPGVDPEREAPRNGQGLQLTIDLELQRVAEQELARGVRESGAASGTVIAIEPATGEILAMASFPSFDPNRLNNATDDAIRIRSVTDQYEPGSTMKAITAAALLEERKLAADDKVNGGNGVLHLSGGATITDDHPVGQTTFRGALEQSSNVVFATLAQQLDDRVFYKYVRDFGFGIASGIDLPGEVRGRLKRPNEFGPSTKQFMSFGYGISATALQVLDAYAAIANGGILMQPHVVKGILTTDGNVDEEIAPQQIRRVVSVETAKILTDMLVGVVERGTGQEARISGVRIAGKTGTAQQLTLGQYGKQNYTASFVGFYPADKPRVAMIVMLDRPITSIYGGTTAAPIFRRIVQKTMTMLQLDAVTQQRIAASSEVDTVIVPDVRGLGLSTADSVLRRLGLRADMTAGAGLILRQNPANGSRIERGAIVHVQGQPQQGANQRPDVIGFPLRRAITVLYAAGFNVRIVGTGKVYKQEWTGETCIVSAR
ncbi:MAG: PASTA domain-containing protein [Candidatus Kapabacteria bacterium]|nr:PASTA domain-containing protein [Candidatus Kapabacteria bacterium]